MLNHTIKTVRYAQRVSKLRDAFSHTIKTVRYTQKVSKLKDVFSHTIKTVLYAQRGGLLYTLVGRSSAFTSMYITLAPVVENRR